MRRRFRSSCRIGALVVLSLLCLPYSSHADNLLSGSGTLQNMVFWFDSAGSTCLTIYPPNCPGTSILGFGPNSLNGAVFGFSDSFISYSEARLPGGLTSVTATIGGGRIEVFLPGTLGFVGHITSGTLDGYYCKQFAPCCCQHVNGQVETTVYFSGNWIIAHYPAPEFWPAEGHFYLVEQHDHGNWINCNFYSYGCGKPPSTIWIDTQIPGTTPEPNTLVLLGSGLVGLAGALRRELIL